ncbi:MAG: hypothetical protein QM539_09935, partial [Alphaproteobacteria bacterium]|nr:hypothetical protein [Alphaproteobacteria bacterium]
MFLFQLGVLSQSSKKDVYLLPGLGSNTYQWNVYNNYIATNYSSKSTVRTDGYVLDASSTLGSIDSQFTILYNNFSDRNFKNIVIGQSLGGIMAQGIAAKYNSSGSLPGFGGIITCGSPNNGVPLFNNWEAAKNFAQSGIINANNVYNSVSRFENQVIGRDILNNNFDYRQYFVLVKKYLDSFKKNVMDIDVNVSAFVRDILKPSSTLISALKSTPNNLNRYK